MGGWKIFKSFLYGSLAGILMGAVCWFFANHLLASFSLYLRVFISIFMSVLFYFLLSKILGIKEYRFFIESLTRRKITSQK